MAGSQLVREVHTNISQYIRDEEVNVMRERPFWAKLQAMGQILYNNSGNDMNWKVRYKRPPVTPYAEMDSVVFAQQNLWTTATLDWRGYTATDAIGIMEQMKNRGTEAIIKVAPQIMKNLVDALKENMHQEIYVDGNATGNTSKLHGVESCLAANATPYSGGYVGSPDDSYAGIDTDLGALGGAWSATTWPIGTGDPEYDAWSPLIVDCTDALWTGSTDTFADRVLEQLRFGITHGCRAASSKGVMDLITLKPESYRLFKEKLQAEESIQVQSGDPLSTYNLGFRDTINFDGCDVTKVFGIPGTDTAGKVVHGYGFVMGELELRCMFPTLFKEFLPDFDIAHFTDRYAVMFLGNLKLNPRHLTTWKELT